MQFDSGKKSRSKRMGRRVAIDTPGIYSHILQMYDLPPSENISLMEFETFALERLKVLKSIETMGIRHVKGSPEYKEAVAKEFKEFYKKGVMKAITNPRKADELDKRKDHISHFILRLVYCRSEELKRWYITQEVDLFKYRFMQESPSSIEEFLQLSKLNYSPIPQEEKAEILNELINTTWSDSGHAVNETNYYKVPFIEVYDLVRTRKVFLRDGMAFVPHHQLVVIILTKFREHLSKGLSMTSRIVPNLEEDDRLVPLLRNMNNVYFGDDYSKKGSSDTKTAEMIEPHLHNGMKQTHHLRHGGRQQYGLFLKGIGVPLEEAMRFWKTEFTKAIDGDKFDKQYSYNIRHNYGKEGKRANYTPYSCVKIITSSAPGPGDHHGCPFRHFDVDLLKQRLSTMSITKEQTEQIIGKTKEGHFQVACGMLFKFKHQAEIDFTTNHPNQYFEESQKILNDDGSTPKPKIAAGVKIVPTKKPSAYQSDNTTSQANNTTQADVTFDDQFGDDDDELTQAMEGIE